MWIRELFQGFCMALADSVPGVSGGSIAFLMGFYEQFITSLNDLSSGNKEKTKNALKWLGKLGVGWVLGMGLAVLVLTAVFEKYIYAVSSLFLGFIAAAALLMFREPEVLEKKTFSRFAAFLAGAALTVAVTAQAGAAHMSADLSHMTLTGGISLFLTAMLAITAMVLPGISGSTILLVFGFYVPVITAAERLVHLDFTALPVLIVFGCGVLAGVLIFVRWIKYALNRFPAQTKCAIIGLMLGSCYSIVQSPSTLDVPMAPLSIGTFHPLFFLLGILLVAGLELYRGAGERRKAAGIERKESAV